MAKHQVRIHTTPTYWVFTVHDGYISFRSDSGYTGSNPFDVIPGGKTPIQKAHANAKWIGLARSQYEILDDRTPARKKNPAKRNARLRFKGLSIGQKFEFESVYSLPHSGMARGPWIKKTARTYAAVDGREHLQSVKVGSVSVEVRGLNPVRPLRKGIRKAVKRGRVLVRGAKAALKGARDVYRALHPGKALPASLSGGRRKNPIDKRKKLERYAQKRANETGTNQLVTSHPRAMMDHPVNRKFCRDNNETFTVIKPEKRSKSKVRNVYIGGMVTLKDLGRVELVAYRGAGTIEVKKGDKYYRVSGLNVRKAK